jgi:hypothetical protein
MNLSLPLVIAVGVVLLAALAGAAGAALDTVAQRRARRRVAEDRRRIRLALENHDPGPDVPIGRPPNGEAGTGSAGHRRSRPTLES